MDNHIRRQTIKIFEEDEKNMKKLMLLKGEKNQSEVCRIALKEAVQFHEMHKEFQALKDEVKGYKESIDRLTLLLRDLYFLHGKTIENTEE